MKMNVGGAGPQKWYEVNLPFETRAGSGAPIVLFQLVDINCSQRTFCFALIFEFEGLQV